MTTRLPDTEKYQGWANHATWSTHLWLANTEEHYRELLKLMGLNDNKNTHFEDRIRKYCTHVWGKKNPDGVAMLGVNWFEIAQAFREE